MDEWEVFPREAVAVGQKAIEQGVARIKMSPKEAFKVAETVIHRARLQYSALYDSGVIQAAPERAS
jgi:malate dehydrogenase (oxaloacetate-decarboxylating)